MRTAARKLAVTARRPTPLVTARPHAAARPRTTTAAVRQEATIDPASATAPPGRTVTVYTRVGCHLCDEAVAIVRAAVGDRATVVLRDVDADPDLYERYTVRVPVVAVDGVEVAEYQVTPGQLDAALSARGPGAL